MQACLSPAPAALLTLDPPQPDESPSVAAGAVQIGRSVRVDLPWPARPSAASGCRVAGAERLATVRASAARGGRWWPVDDDGTLDAAPLLSRHAPRVLAALEQLWHGAAAVGGCWPAVAPEDDAQTPGAHPDGWPPFDNDAEQACASGRPTTVPAPHGDAPTARGSADPFAVALALEPAPAAARSSR